MWWMRYCAVVASIFSGPLEDDAIFSDKTPLVLVANCLVAGGSVIAGCNNVSNERDGSNSVEVGNDLGFRACEKLDRVN